MSPSPGVASDGGELQQRMRAAALAALDALGGDARVDAISEWVGANGGFTADELGQPRGRGRLLDHELLVALTHLRREGLVHDLGCARWRLAEPAPALDADLAAEQRIAELRAMAYEDYVQTPDWLRTRAAALDLAGNHCALQSEHTQHIEVYHRNRDRLGDELADDLVVLCRSCHRLYWRAYGIVPVEETPAAASAKPAARGRSFRRVLRADVTHLR